MIENNSQRVFSIGVINSSEDHSVPLSIKISDECFYIYEYKSKLGRDIDLAHVKTGHCMSTDISI